MNFLVKPSSTISLQDCSPLDYCKCYEGYGNVCDCQDGNNSGCGCKFNVCRYVDPWSVSTKK